MKISTIITSNGIELPCRAMALPCRATVLPCGATVLPCGATVLPCRATVLPCRAMLCISVTQCTYLSLFYNFYIFFIHLLYLLWLVVLVLYACIWIDWPCCILDWLNGLITELITWHWNIGTSIHVTSLTPTGEYLNYDMLYQWHLTEFIWISETLWHWEWKTKTYIQILLFSNTK